MEVDELLEMGLISIEEIIRDIRLEEEFKNKNQCPICGYGDVIGKSCDFCAWEFESDEEQIVSHKKLDRYDTLLKKFGLENYKSPYMKNISAKKTKTTDGRVGKPMNKGLQKHLLDKKLGDRADYYDTEAMLDSRAHYDENLRELGFSREIDEEAYYEELALDYESKETGKDRETIRAENKAKLEADLYKSIFTLANIKTFHEFEDAGNISTVRVTQVFKKSTLKALLDIMSNKFTGVAYTHYLIYRIGMYLFEQDLKACNISELRQLDSEVKMNFSDLRIEKTHVFSIRGRVLRGGSGEDVQLYCRKKQKDLIDDLCSLEEYDLYITDMSYILLIYGVDSYFNNSKDAELAAGLEHAHYYTGGELISDVRNCIVDYRNNFINHFIDILPILKEEYTSKVLLLKLLEQDQNAHAEYKKLVSNMGNINAENVRRKAATINKIEKFLKTNMVNEVGYTVSSRLR